MLSQQLNRLWRLFATALSFVLFGLGGLLVPLVIVPIIYVISADKTSRHRRGKRLIHVLFRFYIQVMKSLGVLSYDTAGLDKLKQAQIVLANHPTLIDVIFLIALIPNANCVVKSGLLNNPFTRGPIRAAGYIINDDIAEDVIDASKQALQQGETLIIFPEGTRSIPGKPLTLKRGAANLAVKTQADITPVLIHCEPITLMKGQPWYKVPATRPHFTIHVEDVISTTAVIEQHKPTLAARKFTTMLTDYFNKEMRSRGRSA